MQTKYLIVGAGAAGLAVGKWLKNSQESFQILEAGEKWGGRAAIGPHRVYRRETIEFLSELQSLEAEEIDYPAFLFQKDTWKELSDTQELKDAEVFYLQRPFFQGKAPFCTWIRELGQSVSENISPLTTVVRIDLEKKVVKTLDGRDFGYEHLIWAAPLEQAIKLLKEKCLIQQPKKAKKDKQDASGRNLRGVLLEFQVSAPIFDFRNSFLLPFRYKEFRLNALGQQYHNAHGAALGFIVYLEDSTFDDTEEIAKAIRALKREAEREIKTLKILSTQEKIFELDSLSGEKPVASQTLRIAENFYYIGPEICVGENETLRNLDRIVDNIQWMQKNLK